jgi:hypothetical protein
MAAILTNPEYPHFAEISRTALSSEPPFTATPTTIWSGAVDCQVSGRGATHLRQDVYVSDYTIYCECIDDEIKTGDQIEVTFKEGDTPIKCKIEQSTTEDVWEVDGVKYGTTIWANKVHA